VEFHGIKRIKMEKFKSAIRPGLAIWAVCMFTLWAFELVELNGLLVGICSASIVQWIPDRAIKRVKEAWNV